MSDVGRVMMVAGVVLVVVGGALYLLGKVGFRGLPGDVSYQGENVRVYFPVVTCLVLSVLLTAGMWVWRWWMGGR